ncbi:hypothetical protein I7I53_04418 [Histoplasma capsulatum var. duboisii H88]|uniref:Uncharacterized protein n=1 Tax=Ajellomyces capsulatus (strain H88) TaxID=544711 RepID=A0A8A1LSX7_AJEC8|nr:hypothetical protein I7I53_04418 [Histoplasma capsulatum var. duboisii H88]
MISPSISPPTTLLAKASISEDVFILNGLCMYMYLPVFATRLFPRQSFSIMRGEMKSVSKPANSTNSSAYNPPPKINTRAAQW